MDDHSAVDLVLMNGVVYTADHQEHIYEAVAMTGNTIVFVGQDNEAARYIGPNTKIINLEGKMVLPGLIDTHMHPPGLALSELYEVHLFDENTLEGYVAAVKNFIAQHPNAQAVFGKGWSWGAFAGEDLLKGPCKEYLDAVTTEIPVVLRAKDGHSLWVNSKALEVNGINTNTPVPEGGVIVREASGELRGILKEGAMFLIAQAEYSVTQYVDAMAIFQQKMHGFGITGMLCISGQFLNLICNACATLEERGQLALRVRAAAVISPKTELAVQFAAIRELQAQYHSLNLKIVTAKFLTDGVVEGATSYLLEPYTLEAGRGADYCGELLWDMDILKQAFAMANEQGLQICVHSTGDASTQKVLDALEDISVKVPNGDYRNTITHLQLVADADILRFKKLNVIASVQPYWQFKGPNWWHNVDYRILGERATVEYPLRSFFESGVVVTSSSDYPVTNVPNPMFAMDIGVTRNVDNGTFYGVEDITDMDDERYLLHPKERATIGQMIQSFTSNAAYGMFMDTEIGSIEPGKLADIVVLDQNLLTMNPIDIDKVKVVMTFFNGKLVYESVV